MALSINSEGIDVAKWLNGRGVTAFVLKYRLAPTEGDAAEEFQRLWSTDKPKLHTIIQKTTPLAIADGHTAVEYVKKHASEFGISPQKIGIMGFSAGGTVTAAAALQYSPDSLPACAAPIYPAVSFPTQSATDDAPPRSLPRLQTTISASALIAFVSIKCGPSATTRRSSTCTPKGATALACGLPACHLNSGSIASGLGPTLEGVLPK